MTDQATATSQSMDVEARITQYLVIRDTIAAKKKELEEALKPYNEAKKLMEGMFLAYLSEHNQTSATTEAGTVHILDRLSATVEDMDLFRKYIVANELWHLVDWKANAPKVEEWIGENDGNIPPGLKFGRFRTTSVRRS